MPRRAVLWTRRSSRWDGSSIRRAGGRQCGDGERGDANARKDAGLAPAALRVLQTAGLRAQVALLPNHSIDTSNPLSIESHKPAPHVSQFQPATPRRCSSRSNDQHPGASTCTTLGRELVVVDDAAEASPFFAALQDPAVRYILLNVRCPETARAICSCRLLQRGMAPLYHDPSSARERREQCGLENASSSSVGTTGRAIPVLDRTGRCTRAN